MQICLLTQSVFAESLLLCIRHLVRSWPFECSLPASMCPRLWFLNQGYKRRLSHLLGKVQAWDLNSFSSSHSPARLFLSNPDLITKLKQEEKQWRADLHHPDREGRPSGKNYKGERKDRNCLRESGLCRWSPSTYPPNLVRLGAERDLELSA